ncbi:VPLPA-CTERM sorting domain-containing protein [Candidatus Litorirhabdus singularis]|nr:VPLPA-CTERM sorting domain-containing protein [Candidatus Litorirhabdus singularis]
MKLLHTLAVFTFMGSVLPAFAATTAGPFDFSYSYSNPYDSNAQTYIHSVTNATLYSESTVRAYIPVTGGATEGATTPGVITYKFDFGTETVAAANVRTNNPTFHWAYSEGHNYFYGSKDGATWVELLNVTTPAYGAANSGGLYDALPTSLLGGTELWFKAELFSFGSNVVCCGASGRNTAQHSRYDINQSPTTETFKLEVVYVPQVPLPAAAWLFGSALLGLGAMKRKRN